MIILSTLDGSALNHPQINMKRTQSRLQLFRHIIKRKNYLYKAKELDRIPYNRYDIVSIMPSSIIGRIKYFFNPINYLYLYAGDWSFCKWSYDAEIDYYDYSMDGIIDVRNDVFANCFIDIWRYRGNRNVVESPENELVMFWWKKRHLTQSDLRFYGKAI